MSTGLPGVNITLLNNQLGRVVPTADGVAGLIMTGAATDELTLGTAYQIFGLEDAAALLVNAAYDTTNTCEVFKHISEFYAQAGNGAELWIMVVAKTVTLAQMAAVGGNFLPVLLNAADGRIRIAGLTRVPDGDYTATTTAGMDDDVPAAMTAAHATAVAFADLYKPVRVLVECRQFTGTVSELDNLRARTNNRVMGVIGNTVPTVKSAAVGLVLGKAAALPVQRNVGRVKDGDLGIDAAYVSSGAAIGTFSAGNQDSLHDKGYVFFRQYQGKAGFYINDDPMAVALSDDYAGLARGRVIDKALTIAYTTYVDELLDDLDIDTNTGRIAPAIMKSYQAKILNAINTLMLNTNEISGAMVKIDPLQNILATDKIEISLFILPKGYSKYIEVEIGFENPQND
jgi:hypothetical protein